MTVDETLTPLELRQRIRTVSDRTAQLRAEQRTLERVRDQLLTELQQTGEAQREAAGGLAELEQRLEAERQRALDLQQEVAATRQEIAAINQRCLDDVNRARELSGRNTAAEEEIVSLRSGLSAAGCTLTHVQERMERLRDRLARCSAPGRGRESK